ncbi:MAG: reprolysin-like metallopeptidase [Bryobacteraceae bacterium]
MKRSLFTLSAMWCFATFLYGQTEQKSVQALTNQARSLRRGGWRTDEFTRAMSARADAFRRLIRTDPRKAVELALNEEEAARLREWTGDVEVTGTWTGAMETRMEDDPITGSRRRYYLTTATDEELEVFPAQPPDLSCQQQVTVQGVRLQAEVATNAVQVAAASASCSTTGVQNVAVILVNFSSAALPANLTQAFVSNAFFGVNSLDTFWREASYNQTSVTGQVLGPFTLPSTVTSCASTSAIRTAAIAAADSQVDFRNFTRLFIITPNAGSCSVGVGTIGCSGLTSADGSFQASTAWMRGDYLQTTAHVVSIAAHEGGHNLGLQHADTYDYGATALGPPGTAGTYNEYWDLFSAMGLSFNNGGTILIGHYAAPQKAALGWLPSSTGYQSVTSSGTFTVLPTETSTAGIKALRVQRPGTNKWLWLEYRQNIGPFDSTLNTYSSNIYRGALVHYDDPNEANYPETLLLDMTPSGSPNNFSDAVLAAGSTWTDPSTTLRINVQSAVSSGMTVAITIGGTFSACDLNQDGSVNVVDVQASVNRALGLVACTTGDVDGNGVCNVIDLQRIVTAVLGGICTIGS